MVLQTPPATAPPGRRAGHVPVHTSGTRGGTPAVLCGAHPRPQAAHDLRAVALSPPPPAAATACTPTPNRPASSARQSDGTWTLCTRGTSRSPQPRTAKLRPRPSRPTSMHCGHEQRKGAVLRPETAPLISAGPHASDAPLFGEVAGLAFTALIAVSY